MRARSVFDLYLITPELPPRELLARAEIALSVAPEGRVGVQLRAPHLSLVDRRLLGRALRELTRRHKCALLISADLGLARELDADGVQLPEHGPEVKSARELLGERALVGASRHDRAGLLAAQEQGASFALLSPVFAVDGKSEPLGVETFGDHVGGLRLPVLALGGVTADRVAALMAAGAAGVAVMREVLGREWPQQALQGLLAAVDGSRVTTHR